MKISPISFNSAFILKRAVRLWITICHFILKIIRKNTFVLKRLKFFFFSWWEQFLSSRTCSKWCVLPTRASLGMGFLTAQRLPAAGCGACRATRGRFWRLGTGQPCKSTMREEQRQACTAGAIWRPVCGIIYSTNNFWYNSFTTGRCCRWMHCTQYQFQSWWDLYTPTEARLDVVGAVLTSQGKGFLGELPRDISLEISAGRNSWQMEGCENFLPEVAP